MEKPADVTPPGVVDGLFNRFFGWLIARGFAPANFFLLEVRGRKSGRVHSTPVDLLQHNGRDYLVAPRGRTQWVRNAEASGVVDLRQGRTRRRYSLHAVADADKPAILKSYLDTYRAQVQRFFPVPAGSPVEAFTSLVDRYPAFEIRAAG